MADMLYIYCILARHRFETFQLHEVTGSRSKSFIKSKLGRRSRISCLNMLTFVANRLLNDVKGVKL